MACYFVYGTLGAGKGIFLAKKMRDYLARGSRVATNVDLFPEKLSPNSEQSISRIPSIFRLEDLEQLGRGCPENEKTKLGGLFLDEGAMWLNSRDWNAKGRKQLIDKFIMIRKLGWDIFIAVQDPESTDKQALGALGENFICCSRLDHFRIPLFSDLVDFIHLIKTKGREQQKSILPHINAASWRKGKTKQGNKHYFREVYKPKAYFGMYDTNQIFQVDNEFIDGKLIDMRAPYSYIPCKTLAQWYPESEPESEPELESKKTEVKKPSKLKYAAAFCLLAVMSMFAVSLYGSSESVPEQVVHVEDGQPQSEQSEKLPIPSYLEGLYISGYLLIKRDGEFHYEYAIHDKNHRGFDAYYYGLTVTAVSPCFAWVHTVDKQAIPITCGVVPQESYTESKDTSLLADVSVIDTVGSVISEL